MPYSILHISDLHRSPTDPISNDELVSALIGDRARYINEEPQVRAPDAIIVSGDIIQGVPLGTSNYAVELAQQYATAEAFLDELTNRILGGDRSRVVIIPGNHDIDWNTALSAMSLVSAGDEPKDVAGELHREGSSLRWDWRNRQLYRIVDEDAYAARLDAFWTFFGRFYHGVQNLLHVTPKADYNLFSLMGHKIGVAAFNSCEGNDCLVSHGLIKREAIARSHLEMDDSGHPFQLRIAVWHHSIEGPPYRTDYMDIDIVRGMIGRGYRLGLYGHQHRAQAIAQEIYLPDRERMAAVCAGSLCAGRRELPVGTYRQYNVLEIADDFRSVRVHVRSMSVANLFGRTPLGDFGGATYATLEWTPPKTAGGSVATPVAQYANREIEEAEAALKSDDARKALQLLADVDRVPGSYARRLYLEAAHKMGDWRALVTEINPPNTIDELMYLLDAYSQSGDFRRARESLDQFSGALELPQETQQIFRQRLDAEEKMRA